MGKVLCWCMVMLILLGMTAALAEGVTIRTTSMFGGTDPSAPAYRDIIRQYEQETGNKVEDSSAQSDETWKSTVLADFAANNEADVVFYFAATADSQPILSRVVPVEEIRAEYPDYGKDVAPSAAAAVTEPDGKLYALPVRGFWEAMFVNEDLFLQNGLELPTDWVKLTAAIEKFKEVGIVPIAVSLADVPHYMYEYFILAMGGQEDHCNPAPKTADEIPQSWVQALSLFKALNDMGAFPVDVTATTDPVAVSMFHGKRAAMKVDGSWFANGIPEENWDSTVVMPFPIPEGGKGEASAIIGGYSSGFYITRSAWDNPERREAAVRLVEMFTTPENIARMSITIGGKLAASAAELQANAASVSAPIDSRMGKEAWNLLVQSASGLADGSLMPEAVLKDVIATDAF